MKAITDSDIVRALLQRRPIASMKDALQYAIEERELANAFLPSQSGKKQTTVRVARESQENYPPDYEVDAFQQDGTGLVCYECRLPGHTRPNCPWTKYFKDLKSKFPDGPPIATGVPPMIQGGARPKQQGQSQEGQQKPSKKQKKKLRQQNAQKQSPGPEQGAGGTSQTPAGPTSGGAPVRQTKAAKRKAMQAKKAQAGSAVAASRSGKTDRSESVTQREYMDFCLKMAQAMAARSTPSIAGSMSPTSAERPMALPESSN